MSNGPKEEHPGIQFKKNNMYHYIYIYIYEECDKLYTVISFLYRLWNLCFFPGLFALITGMVQI